MAGGGLIAGCWVGEVCPKMKLNQLLQGKKLSLHETFVFSQVKSKICEIPPKILFLAQLQN